MAKITIDFRMANHSGIGTYLKNIIPKVTFRTPENNYSILGDINVLSKMEWTSQSNISIINCTSPIFSIREQLELPNKIPVDSDLYWCPHFNIPLFYRGRMLVTIHDILHISMPHLAGQWYKRLYARLLLGFVKNKSSKIITVSEFTRRELIRLLKFPTEKIHPIHLGVDENWFKASQSMREKGEPYFVYVGNVKSHKNLLNFIKAFELITGKIPHKLVIIGKKEGFLTGDSLIESYANRLKDRIIFTGYVEEKILCKYVANATAMVFPSLYEGFGLPPLEAMACGCPVIASHAASIPEVCGDAALYFNPYDVFEIAEKMMDLVSNHDIRLRLVNKGRSHAKLFTWDQCASKTITIIQEILKKN